nr:hypothetical protein [Tanacetum cinerariifolium]
TRLSTTAEGKQPAREITPTEPTDVERTEAEQLKIAPQKEQTRDAHLSTTWFRKSLRRMMMRIQSLVRVVMRLMKVNERVTKKKQDKRKRKVLIQFPKHLKEVRMKAMMRRIRN